MKQRLELFYETLGDRGIMFILYAFSVVVNTLFSLSMELPAIYPDEINTAGIAAMYSGRDWSGLLRDTGISGGYIGALFYAPIFVVFNNPFAAYKAMLVVNALLISFIPLIAYYMAAKLGVPRLRYKVLIALCCGMYVSYVANSKFIWNETITCLIGWILALCLFTSWSKKDVYSRISMSILLGFLCAVAYAANVRLIAETAAILLTVLLARIIFREKLVNVPVLLISLCVSFFAESFTRKAVLGSAFGDSGNAQIISPHSSNANFFGVLFSHIYSLMTSSLGLGAMAAALTAILVIKWISEGIKSRERTLEDGTKVYEPNTHMYSARISVFAMMQFLMAGCTAIFSALFTVGTGKFAAESTVFGRYTDNIAPLAIFLVLTFIFTYGIDLKKLWLCAGVYAYACICFAIVGFPIVSSSENYLQSSVPGMFPIGVRAGAESSITAMSYVIMSSCVFSMLTIFIVIVSCSKKHRKTFIGFVMLCMISYTTVYTGFVYLPRVGSENAEKSEPYRAVSKLLYNDPQSPPIVVYDEDTSLAATIQFLNPKARVGILSAGERVPESCLLIASNGVQMPTQLEGSYDLAGRTDKYSVYAYGEAARDFIRYNSEKGNTSQ
ncbi:MAG: hypothetical protein HDT42_09965 [Ruminococcaceae bacterium]|nr:hypothetical protein [Oscillospiraceae bacterium]